MQKSRSSIFGFGLDRNNKRQNEEKPNLEDRVKSEIFSNNARSRNDPFINNLKNDNKSNNVHKRQESDSRISLNFVRGFRRENTDFFPLSKRHSAVLGGEQISPSKQAAAPQVPLRSSAIFRRNQNKGEPILTDFTSRSIDAEQGSSKENGQIIKTPQRQSGFTRNFPDFLRPRREKTESVIVVKNATARKLYAQQQQEQQQLLLQQQQVKQTTIKHCVGYK